MPRLVAFLRAINVGGRVVKMEPLKQAFAPFGGQSVETFLASGNVIFDSEEKPTAALEQEIERHLKQTFDIEIATFVRKMSEVVRAVEDVPFSKQQLAEAVALNVGLLKKKLTKKQQETLEQQTSDIDQFATTSREVYWLCKRKQSDSDFSNAMFERRVTSPCSFRTIRTLERISEKFGEREL